MGIDFFTTSPGGFIKYLPIINRRWYFAAAVWASPDQDTLIATRKYTDSKAGKVRFENEAFVISNPIH
jgi:hypothetical protein